jgi:hypothetical protein
MSDEVRHLADVVSAIARNLIDMLLNYQLRTPVPDALWTALQQAREPITKFVAPEGLVPLGQAHLIAVAMRRINAALDAVSILNASNRIRPEDVWRREQTRFEATVREVSYLLLVWARTHDQTSALSEDERAILRRVFLAISLPIQRSTRAELLHRRLDAIRYASCERVLRGAEVLALLMRSMLEADCEIDVESPYHEVPINEFLTPGIRPIAGGTPREKLRALRRHMAETADLHPNDFVPPTLNANLDAALEAVERRLEPLTPEQAFAVMHVASRAHEGGMHNLPGAMDTMLLRELVRSLMLIDDNDEAA